MYAQSIDVLLIHAFYPSPLFTRPCHSPLYEQATLSTLFVHVISRKRTWENRIMEAHRANPLNLYFCVVFDLLGFPFFLSLSFSLYYPCFYTCRCRPLTLLSEIFFLSMLLSSSWLVAWLNNRRSTTVCEPRAHTHTKLCM